MFLHRKGTADRKVLPFARHALIHPNEMTGIWLCTRFYSIYKNVRPLWDKGLIDALHDLQKNCASCSEREPPRQGQLCVCAGMEMGQTCLLLSSGPESSDPSQHVGPLEDHDCSRCCSPSSMHEHGQDKEKLPYVTAVPLHPPISRLVTT